MPEAITAPGPMRVWRKKVKPLQWLCAKSNPLRHNELDRVTTGILRIKA